MKLSIILFGSTGMVGQGVLLESLESPHVASVLVVNRTPCGVKHEKLREVIHRDFHALSSLAPAFAGYNTCFFCLGVSALGMSETEYHKITYDIAVHAAGVLWQVNKNICFCYVSGAGTDGTEKGRIMWARIKGKTENAILAMPFQNAYMFRPGYIQPLRGIKSKVAWYNVVYSMFKPLYFLLKPFKGFVTNTGTVGKAMIQCALKGYPKKIIENPDIHRLALDDSR